MSFGIALMTTLKDRTRFLEAMNRCGGLTETARRVAIEFLFVHHNDAHGGSFPSHGLLAERLGVTRLETMVWSGEESVIRLVIMAW